MWIELLKPVDDKKVGEFMDVEETTARAYIAAGFAKDAGDGPDKIIMSRSLEKFREELSKFTRSAAEAIDASTQEIANRPRIQVTKDEADKNFSMRDFMANVHKAIAGKGQEAIDADKRLRTVYGDGRAMGENTGATGGYLTPKIFEAEIFKIAAEKAIMRPLCKNVPLGAREVEWPALDQYKVPAPGQSSFYGGVQVYRKSENVQRTSTAFGTTKISLVAQDITALLPVGRDLVQDTSGAVNAMVPELLGEAIGWREDWEAINGNGAGQLMGYLNSQATIVVTRTGGAGTDTFSYVDAAQMSKYLLPSSMGNHIWIVHPYKMEEIWTMQDVSGRYIFIPNISNTGPATQGLAGTLLGRPIYTSEKMPSPGSQGDVSLIDPTRYLLGTREGGIEIGLSEHFAFDLDEIYYRAKLRNDGKPQLKKPITLADGAGTNLASCFIALK